MIAIAVYGLFMAGLGVYSSRRVESQEDYLVAGRKLPLWLAWGTLLATWFGAGTIIGASEAAREEGVRGTLLDPFASGLALILAKLQTGRALG
jgi:SSS family solute:Na+ symporter